MFFRKKKKEGSAPSRSGPRSRTPRERPEEGGTTQFLTGHANLDQRNVQVLPGRDRPRQRVSETSKSSCSTSWTRPSTSPVPSAGSSSSRAQTRREAASARRSRARRGEPCAKRCATPPRSWRRVLEEQAPLRSIDSNAEAMQLGTSVFDLEAPRDDVRAAPGSRPSGSARTPSEACPVRRLQGRDARVQGRGPRLVRGALAANEHCSRERSTCILASLEKARLEQSLEIASTIQSGLMPQIPKDLEGLDVHGWYRSAEGTSGDFYDFVKTKDGRLGVVVGDVTGHGIGPALITATAQASLRSYLRMIEDPGQAVTMLNQDLAERMEDGLFLTSVLGVDPSRTGRSKRSMPGTLRRFVYGARRRARSRRSTGTVPALGMIDDFDYAESASLVLEPGDILLAFTDGLTEARDLEGSGRPVRRSRRAQGDRGRGRAPSGARESSRRRS